MRPITIRIKKKKLRALRMIFAGLLILLAIACLEKRITPIIENFAGYQAKLLATRIINDAVLEVIEEDALQYSDMVSLSQGFDGQVTSMTTNMAAMNRLKSLVTNRVGEALEQNTVQTVEIPLGNLLGSAFLSGHGPMVTFRLMPSSYVDTQFHNEFESAGINQTLHRVMLSVDVRVSAMIPLYTVSSHVSTNVCLAETMIVGRVPSAYTDIDGDKTPLTNQLSDYGAGK